MADPKVAAPAAAIKVAAPTRVQPARVVKTTEYKEKKAKEARKVVVRKVKKPREKINFKRYVLEALKTIAHPTTLATIRKRVAKATGKTSKKISVRCRIALRSLLRLGKASVNEQGQYVAGKAKVSAKKKVVAKAVSKKKKTTKKVTKKAAAAAGAGKKKKAAPKKKKAAPKKAAAPKKRAKKIEAAEGASVVPLEAGIEGPKWEYYDGNRGGWHAYSKDASDLVETEYQNYLKDPAMLDVRSVRSGSWAYQVDFVNMKQTNIEHASHTVRDIRRNPPADKRKDAEKEKPTAEAVPVGDPEKK